jgi:hypothetical protein
MSEKSIVVFNTPTKCNDCYFNGYRWNVCILTDEDIDEYVNPNKTKPEWCPLRPLPRKKVPYFDPNANTYDEEEERSIMNEIDGYNRCIDEITGEIVN